MEKEYLENVLEDFKVIKFKTINAGYDYGFKVWDDIEQALLELKQIKEADIGEAIKALGIIKSELWDRDYSKTLVTIENTLLRTQELEKKNAYIEKIKTMMKQKDCVLRYVESEDCFAVKTILTDWYKLTPQFVDDNVREEIKPLPVIEKIKQLKEENTEYKETLRIIFEKRVDVFRLKVLDFNTFNQLQRSCKLPELTQEEFKCVKNGVNRQWID